MPTPTHPSTTTLAPRISEPPPTEEDRRRMREVQIQMEEGRRLAIEAGERLPPITVDLWGVGELK